VNAVAKVVEVEGETDNTPFRAVTPDGRWTVEVRQVVCPLGSDPTYPWFTGTLTLDRQTIVESLTTTDTNKIIHWARRQMVESMRRTTPGGAP